MAAANTDNFLKVYENFSTTIGAGGVTSGTATTIPLTSTTNLPTDTAVAYTINRVDSSGNATNNAESGVGVVSGTNLINCTRGTEGTAAGWGAGITVEILWTATAVNRLMSGILVEHNQDGTHAKVNGNTVPSGTDTVALLTATQTLTNKTLTSPTVSSPTLTGTETTPKIQGALSAAQFPQVVGEYNNGNSGTTLTIDWSKGDHQLVTMTGSCTFTYSNAVAGQTLTLRIVENATGGYTVTLPTSKWPGGTAGTFTTTANAINLLIVYYDGTNYLTQVAAGFS